MFKKKLFFRLRLSYKCPYEAGCRAAGCPLSKHNEAQQAILRAPKSDKTPMPQMTEESRGSCLLIRPPICDKCKVKGAVPCKVCKKEMNSEPPKGPLLMKTCPFCLSGQAAYVGIGDRGQNLTMDQVKFASLRSDKPIRHWRESCDVTMKIAPSPRFIVVYLLNRIVREGKNFPQETPPSGGLDDGKRQKREPREKQYETNINDDLVQEAIESMAQLSTEKLYNLLRSVEFEPSQHGPAPIAAQLLSLSVLAEDFRNISVDSRKEKEQRKQQTREKKRKLDSQARQLHELSTN